MTSLDEVSHWRGAELRLTANNGILYQGILSGVDAESHHLVLTRIIRTDPEKPGRAKSVSRPVIFKRGQIRHVELVDDDSRSSYESDDESTTDSDPLSAKDDEINLNQVNVALEVGWSLPLVVKKASSLKKLRRGLRYEVPDLVITLIEHNLQPFPQMTKLETIALANITHMMEEEGMTEVNYNRYLTLWLYLEEVAQMQEIVQFNMYSAKVHFDGGKQLRMEVKGLIDRCPSLVRGDSAQLYGNGHWSYLTVEDTIKNDLYFEFNPEFIQRYFSTNNGEEWGKFDVQFMVNQSTLRSMHVAIASLQQFTLKSLFPHTVKAYPFQVKPSFKWINGNVSKNPEQAQAVKMIVAGSSWPLPYILFGPPGTGKTSTVVEAILQVIREIPGSRVLVCAPSNAASDLLAVRLVQAKLMAESEILRLISPSQQDKNDELDPALDNIVHYGKMQAKRLMKYRLIVVTLGSAVRLFTSGVPQGHFTHLFIDEAGQATEPECLIPISLSMVLANKWGHVILAGDPMQLGPVILSTLAGKFGMNRSLMQRLMEDYEIYQKDPVTGARNSGYTTKLVKNFRSHEKLLLLPSKLFYDNELVACADQKSLGQLCNFSWLPKPGFPLVFHGVKGHHEKGEHTPSLLNETEVLLTLDYVQKLIKSVPQDRIGIVSPYRRQVRMIKELLSSRFNISDIQVGSVEEFQGGEKEVMIFSTVRSSVVLVHNNNNNNKKTRPGLGFLVNQRRFNVGISRAKSLMIVIGDPRLLSRDQHWGELIDFAVRNGAYTGVSVPNVPSKKAKKNKKTMVKCVN